VDAPVGKGLSFSELFLDTSVVLLAQGEEVVDVLAKLGILLLAHFAEVVQAGEQSSNGLLLGRPFDIQPSALVLAELLLLSGLADLGPFLDLQDRRGGGGLTLLDTGLACARLSVHGSRCDFLVALPAVHAPHVVEEVVATGEALTRRGSLAIGVVAKVRASSMTMHTVCFSFVAEKARG
jgi:hypothetical protein